MKRRLLVGLISGVIVATMSVAASAQLADDIEVGIDPTNSSVVLGEHLDLTVSVTNHGAAESPPLIVHLDITDPDQSTSVDPEDWTPTLSQTIGEISPGETVAVDWTIQPISGGTFVAYAVVLSPGVDSIATSNVLEVRVATQRTLNPGGILPVAIAAPTIIGVLLLVQIRLARRNRSHPRKSSAAAMP